MDFQLDQWKLSLTNALQTRWLLGLTNGLQPRWLLSLTNALEEGGSSGADLVDDQGLEACAALGQGQQVPASAGERARHHLRSPDHRLAHLPPGSRQLLAALLHLQHHARCRLPRFEKASLSVSSFVGAEQHTYLMQITKV